MKGFVGEFEELVLLTIVHLDNDAYGVAIKEDIEERAKRALSIGALHTTLTRLEEKGYIKSWMGNPLKYAADEENDSSKSRNVEKWSSTI